VLFLNPRWRLADVYGPAMQAVLNQQAFAAAKAEISSWPGYEPTPLISGPAMARAHSVGSAACKHEGYRFGIGSFKPTGPTYAMLKVLKAAVQRAAGTQVSTADLVARRYEEITGNIVVSAPTSGNHGRALAWGAQTFGCRAVLYMNDGVSAGREAAIAAYGGQVVRVSGAYEDVVQRLHTDAAAQGHIIVGDGGTRDYPDVPRHIMQGYALVADELLEQTRDAPLTHLFVPGGGGILAAACCAHLWDRLGARRPKVVVVEPEASRCLQASAMAVHAVQVAAATSVMDGLVVEKPSAEAWPLLAEGAYAFLTVSDNAAVEAMRAAATPANGEPALVIGDTGSAAWAGFVTASQDHTMRQQLGLDEHSRVAFLATENATDPLVYRELTGMDPATVG
jgi:diaminopropionate ammonia-lyase